MRRAGWWLLFVVAVLGGLFFLLTMIIAVGQAFSGHDGACGAIGAGVITGVITIVLFGVAWEAEHRARGRIYHHHPSAAIAAPRPRPRVPRSRRGRRDTPGSALTLTVIFLVATACWGVGAGFLGRDWRQSVATQDHGISVQAKVTDTYEISHSSRSGTYYTTHLVVAYPEPVDGRSTGEIRAPHREDQHGIGSTVAVRVDRGDPDHVELAGVPDTGPAGFIVLVVLGVFFAFMTYACAAGYVKLLRLRRRSAAPPPG